MLRRLILSMFCISACCVIAVPTSAWAAKNPIKDDLPANKEPEVKNQNGLQNLQEIWANHSHALYSISLSVLGGMAVAAIYKLTVGRNRKNSKGLPTTLVLLAGLIAVVTQVIGDNLARAFGLAGALSIVRFRAVVEDTGDTAFVIFAVVVGMAFGADHGALGLLAIIVIGITAGIMTLFHNATAATHFTLTVKVAVGLDPEKLLSGPFQTHLEERTLLTVGTAQKGTAVEMVYSARPRNSGSAFALVSELNKVEGVCGVEWKS